MSTNTEQSLSTLSTAPSSSTPVRNNGFFNSLRWHVILFCTYGFLVNFKPSEANLVPYLTTVKQFNNTVVYDKIFPYWTYSLLPSIVFIGLFAEATRYKPSMILGSLCRVATRCILIWGTSLLLMQVMQVTFGVASATDIIFFTYMFNLTMKQNYQRVTSYLRAASLFGYVLASFLGQILVLKDVPLVVLFYISFVSECVAAILSFFFPATNVWHQIFSKKFLIDVRTAYKSRVVLGWSLWFIFAYSVYDLVANYMTNVWSEIDADVYYNGYIVGAARLTGAAGALIPAIPSVENFVSKTSGVALVVILTLLSSLAAGFNFFNRGLILSFSSYVLFIGLMEFMIAVCYSNVAKNMKSEVFATVFTINTFASVALQTIVQVSFGDKGLGLNIYELMMGFASIQLATVFIFTAAGIFLMWPELRTTRAYSLLVQTV